MNWLEFTSLLAAAALAAYLIYALLRGEEL
jgi:K+-transporting ATPase KdpF subunit